MKKFIFLLYICFIALNAQADPKKYWDKSFWKNATVQDVKELILICQKTRKDDIQKCYNENLYSLAGDCKNVEAIEYIVKASANVNAPNLFKKTPLNSAVQSNPKYEIVAKLIELGAEVTQEDFETACSYTKNPKTISLLLKHGAKINKVSKDSYTPLIIASQQNPNPKIIATLIKNGANLEYKDDMGWTALIWAISMNKNPQIVDALLDAGANIDVTDNFGKKPIDYAKENKNFFNSDAYKRLKK